MHCVRFDNCQSCGPTGVEGCGSCRKSLPLRGMQWKYWKQVRLEDQHDADLHGELQDGEMHDDTELSKGTRVAVLDRGYGLATVVGFHGALIGANTHEIVFENCYSCAGVQRPFAPAAGGGSATAAGAPDPEPAAVELAGGDQLSPRDNCDICRRLIQLKTTSWKVLSEDSPTSDQAMARGTRVAVFDHGYGLATIDGYRGNLVGGNNFLMVFDGCVVCNQTEGCDVCRKSLKLQNTAWQMLMVDGSIHHKDTELPNGTRVVVEDAGYGLATIDGFQGSVVGANSHTMIFDNCQSCHGGGDGCVSCRKTLQLRGTRWKILLKDGSSHDDAEMPLGTRVLVQDAAYGVATISGFSSALLGANTHEMVFDRCPACVHKRNKGCTLCCKALQLKRTKWSLLDRSEVAQQARAKPRWVGSDEQLVCMLCDAEFGLLTRHHHCRCCGWLVCSACCPDNQLIGLDRWVSSDEDHPIKFVREDAGAPTKLKRVCNSCVRLAPREVEVRCAQSFQTAAMDEGVPPSDEAAQ
jgi:hypothetical protein